MKKKIDIASLWPWPSPKVTNFHRVLANVVKNFLAKSASKSVHPFGWKFGHKQTDRQADTHTNCSKNITPPRFCGSVKTHRIGLSVRLTFCSLIDRQTAIKYNSSTISRRSKKSYLSKHFTYQRKCLLTFLERRFHCRWNHTLSLQVNVFILLQSPWVKDLLYIT